MNEFVRSSKILVRESPVNMSSDPFSSLTPFFGSRDLNPSWGMEWDLMPFAQPKGLSTFQPRVDVSEKENTIALHCELPGIDKKDINVEVIGDMLSIRGNKERSSDFKDWGYRRTERSFGSFETRMRLPEGCSADKIKTSFNNGVLEVLVEKPEGKTRPQTRQIKIE